MTYSGDSAIHAKNGRLGGLKNKGKPSKKKGKPEVHRKIMATSIFDKCLCGEHAKMDHQPFCRYPFCNCERFESRDEANQEADRVFTEMKQERDNKVFYEDEKVLIH